ncbi:MAG: hypothetical protein H6R17_2840 [Proteobacteria bacterium]|nr:hypothetical protein [Pseudomonadota bacterium]
MKYRYQWSDYFAAFSIVVGAALSCSLCFTHGDRGACAGVLLVFGMALIGVLGGRSERRLMSPVQRRSVLEKQTTHRAYSSFALARP